MPQIRSDLPIVTPDPPRRSQAERYGSLLYLGIAGLVVVVLLVGWFAWGVWSLRSVWGDIYRVSDPRRPEAERVAAAEALARDGRATQRQLWDLALNRALPERARYVLAEALTPEAVSVDPRGYALAVVRSEGWPDWLRLLLLRPLAIAMGEGRDVDPSLLKPLRRHPDPILRFWAAYAQAVSPRGDAEARAELDREARRGDDRGDLARLLWDAARSDPSRRGPILARATAWLRAHHPDAARLWGAGPAPELH